MTLRGVRLRCAGAGGVDLAAGMSGVWLGSLGGAAMYFAEKPTILPRSPVAQCGLIGGVHGDDLDLNWPGPVTLRAGDQPRGASPQTNLFEVDGKPASRAYMGTVPPFPFLCFLQGAISGEGFPRGIG